MKKLILLILAIIVMFRIAGIYKEDYYIIPSESIRIRIIPNSNTPRDQYLKKQVQTNIELDIEQDLKESKTIRESRKILKSNIKNYNRTIKNVLKKENSNQKFDIELGYHYFPEKKYKGVKYNKGTYESLLITLGKAEGSNWWCVLFPPICSLEVDSSNKENIEYSLYVKEIFEKYIK